MKIGIVGLPNVGKSTLFNALTKQKVEAQNFPFTTIEPNVGIVSVPDERLDNLKKIFNPKSFVPAIVEFVDIAGLIKGAASGQGLGNKFLSHIRSVDAILQVVRAFEDTNIQHVEGSINPQHDIETIETELALADLETVEKRISKTENDAKTSEEARAELGLLIKLKDLLGEGRLANSFIDEGAKELLQELNLLTAKPFLYAFNIDKSVPEDILKKYAGRAVCFNAKLEDELNEMSDAERIEMAADLGIQNFGLDLLIKAAYLTLGLIAYFTAGEQEVRSWTIHTGDTAPEAAGTIHTDFQKGFIAAEIINYDEFIQYGTYQLAKAAGKVRTEGRDYIMKDGDMALFRFNL